MASFKDMNLGTLRLLAKATGKFAFPEKDGVVQLAVQFVIRDDDPEFACEYITYYQRLETEQNFEFAWKALRACGVTSDTFDDLRGIDANEVEIVVEAKMWEGKKQVQVKYVNMPGGPEIKVDKPASSASLKMLSAKAKAAALKSRGAASGSSAAAPVAPPRFSPPPSSTPEAPPGDFIPPPEESGAASGSSAAAPVAPPGTPF